MTVMAKLEYPDYKLIEQKFLEALANMTNEQTHELVMAPWIELRAAKLYELPNEEEQE